MSAEYHLYTKDGRPVTAGELAAAAGADGERIIVLGSFREWGEYEVLSAETPLDGSVDVCLVSSRLPQADDLVARLLARRPVGDAPEAGEIRVCDLSVSAGPDWQDEGEAEELRAVYDGRYVSYRKKAKLHYAVAGGARAAGDLHRLLKWIESLRGGLLEDPQSGTYSIDGKEAAWPAEALADAKMTDRRCAKCRKPLPGYRKTCKWCGMAAGAGG